MSDNGQRYETPIVEIWKMDIMNGLLQGSIEATRESYGKAEETTWE
ncbi:MAG: hypothetical protein IKW99_05285 [Bacteroidales bacterium]|nr:hypothetical protein [Bacteroidales bacterium]